MAADSVQIRVSTAAMRETAAEVKTRLTVVAGEFDNMISVMNNTSSYWQGDAADAFRSRLSGKRGKMDTMLLRLKEYISDLTTMSVIYETTERMAEQEAAALDTDVIF